MMILRTPRAIINVVGDEWTEEVRRCDPCPERLSPRYGWRFYIIPTKAKDDGKGCWYWYGTGTILYPSSHTSDRALLIPDSKDMVFTG
eukprot:scaffold44671_cov183-Amphora_coffeaeformis.AAC.2